MLTFAEVACLTGRYQMLQDGSRQPIGVSCRNMRLDAEESCDFARTKLTRSFEQKAMYTLFQGDDGSVCFGFDLLRNLGYLSWQTAIALSPLYGDKMRSFHFPWKFAPTFAICSATPAQIFLASAPVVSMVTSTREW